MQKHIACTDININAVSSGLYSANIVLIVFYLLIVQSIICYKNPRKNFNQFATMSLFILCYTVFHKFSLVLYFSLIRVRKHWRDDITQEGNSKGKLNPEFTGSVTRKPKTILGKKKIKKKNKGSWF